MSRKFARRKQINQAAARMTNQALEDIKRHVFRPKPRWMPKFVWKLIVGMVIR